VAHTTTKKYTSDIKKSVLKEDAMHAPDQPAPPVQADAEMERVLRTAPLTTFSVHDPFETRLARWKHQPFHDVVKPMSDHVVMTYLGAMQRLERTSGRDHHSSVGRRGSITFIPAGSSSRWDIHGPMDIVQAYMAPELLEQIAKECPGPTTSLVESTARPDSLLATLLEKSIEPSVEPAYLENLYRQQLTTLIAIHVVKAHRDIAEAFSNTLGGLSPYVLRMSLERLSTDDDRDISLGALADGANLSRFHFCRAFKKSTGVSPHEWLRQRRMERAMAMLRDPRLQVTEIAERQGYATLTAFSVAFKRHTGLTPSEWRRAAL